MNVMHDGAWVTDEMRMSVFPWRTGERVTMPKRVRLHYDTPEFRGIKVVSSDYLRMGVGKRPHPERGGVVVRVSAAHWWPMSECRFGPCVQVQMDYGHRAWFWCGFFRKAEKKQP